MHDNRSKPRAKSASASQSQKRGSLRYLDLSFEGAHQANTGQQAVLNNGFRPHGGHRGTKKYPLSQFSVFSKSADQLEVDKLLEDEADQHQYSGCSSPAWTLDVCKETSHSPESPLFVHKLLSPSRINQQYDPGNYPQAFFSSHKRVVHKTKDGKQYYRPNRTHQYLSATELRDCVKNEVNVKLGRPTRTTLLRARQRCSSAPVNAYEARRELLKKLEQRCESRRSVTPSYHIRDMMSMSVPEGESLHSYLTGARYNRAHCLDAKSMSEHGVYMPRHNPLACFIMKKPPTQFVDESEDSLPPAPPDSPASLSDAEDTESMPLPTPPPNVLSASAASPSQSPITSPRHSTPPRSPMVPPQPPSSPRPSSRGAWEDRTQVQVDITPVENKDSGEQGEAERNNAVKGVQEQQQHHHQQQQQQQCVLETILDLDDGLNIKGMGMGATRPRSARPPPSSRSVTYPIRPQSAQMLPSVVIHGTAISKPSSQGPDLTSAPPSSPQREGSQAQSAELPEKTVARAVIKMEDKSVNVPSVAEGSEVVEQTEEEDEEKDPMHAEDDTVQEGVKKNTEVEDAATSEVVEEHTERPSTAKGKKVRFSGVGHKAESEVEDFDRVRFFLTEQKNQNDNHDPEEKMEEKTKRRQQEELPNSDTVYQEGEEMDKQVHQGEELKDETEETSGEIGQGEGASFASDVKAEKKVVKGEDLPANTEEQASKHQDKNPSGDEDNSTRC